MNFPARTLHCLTLLVAVVCGLITSASAEWNEKVLYSFRGGTDGAVPAGGVVFDKSGNLYGATEDGGANGCNSPGPCGTVFELSPPAEPGGAWTETVLYVFKGQAYGDGATPEGSVIIDNAGNLYGTTGYGGTGLCTLLGGPVGCGTVYELSPPAQAGDPWTEKVLYSFQGGNDGYVATGTLVFDKAGNLYGATLFGGGQGTTCDSLYGGNCGTIFKLSPPQQSGAQWTESVLHSFAGGTDGAVPNGGLALDNRGAVYGTTFYGGNETGECAGGIEGIGCGTVVRLIPPARLGETWTEKILIRFDGQDGATPASGVIFDRNDNLYGTTYAGAINGNGEVFELAKPLGNVHTWAEIVLYRFTGGNDGYNPTGGPSWNASGDLYGTTEYGNSFRGTVFRLHPPNSVADTWSLTPLYGFTGGPDGAFPAAKLILDNGGNLYGTTQSGGGKGSCSGYCGTMFEVRP